MVLKVTSTAIISIAILTYLPAQIQIGVDIIGEASADEFGTSVSISGDGQRLAIGAQFNDGNGESSGHARVYEWDGFDWQQLGDDLDGENVWNRFGKVLALSANGERLIVGSPMNYEFGDYHGHARVFAWDGSAWIQMGEDIDGEKRDMLGSAVAISNNGSRIVVGAPEHGELLDANGKVAIYEWNENNWEPLGEPILGPLNSFAGAGVAISGDGNRIASNSIANGALGVFEWNGNNWIQLGEGFENLSFSFSFPYFISLSEDGNRLVLSPSNINGQLDYRVLVYEWDGTNWNKIGNDILPEGITGSLSVAISANGDRVIIGSERNEENGYFAGHARIFEWNGNDWSQVGFDIDGESGYDKLGGAVSISSDGNIVAVGAVGPGFGIYNAPPGKVQVYQMDVNASVNNNSFPKMKIFPNPFQNKISIQGLTYQRLNLLDQLGVIRMTVESEVEELDLSWLEPGIYYLEFFVDNQLFTKKLVKK